MYRFILSFLLILIVPGLAECRTLMNQEQALVTAFPGTKPVRQTFFLTPEQQAAARRESGAPIDNQLIVRYVGPAGFAYFDRHRVRTLPETIMVVVSPSGTVERVEILSFDEPTDYFPKRRWIDQLLGRRLDRELALNRGVRPISGATLTGHSIVDATRRVLAIHHILGPGAPGR